MAIDEDKDKDEDEDKDKDEDKSKNKEKDKDKPTDKDKDTLRHSSTSFFSMSTPSLPSCKTMEIKVCNFLNKVFQRRCFSQTLFGF